MFLDRLLSFCVLLSACGGKTEDARGQYANSGSANVGGASGAADGASGVVDCTAAPVTFQAIARAGSAAQWCLGSPGLTDSHSVLALETASGPVALTSEQSLDCSACDQQPNPRPEPPGTWNQVTVHSSMAHWNGCLYVSSVCSGQASACSNMISAPNGRYTATLCGFVNPNPEWSGGCEEAPDSTPVACVQVEFDYPTQSPVVVGMPSP